MIKDLTYYCFDGGPFALFQAAMCILYAAVFIFFGAREMSSRPVGRRREQQERRQWTKELLSRHIAADSQEVEGLLPPIRATWRRLRAPAWLGAGIGMLIGFCLFATASALLTGTLLLLTAMQSYPTYGTMAFFGAFGYLLGLVRGTRHMRRERSAEAQYADVHPRLLRSYRSMRVPLVLSAVVLFFVAATIVEAPYVSPRLHIGVAGGTEYLIPKSPVFLALPLIVMVMAIAVMEALAARIVSLPRLVSGLTPSRAIQVDDMLRAKMVMTIEAIEVLLVAFLASSDVTLTDFGLGYSHSATADLMSFAGFFLSLLLGFTGFFSLILAPLAAGVPERLYAPWRARWRTGSSF